MNSDVEERGVGCMVGTLLFGEQEKAPLDGGAVYDGCFSLSNLLIKSML